MNIFPEATRTKLVPAPMEQEEISFIWKKGMEIVKVLEEEEDVEKLNLVGTGQLWDLVHALKCQDVIVWEMLVVCTGILTSIEDGAMRPGRYVNDIKLAIRSIVDPDVSFDIIMDVIREMRDLGEDEEEEGQDW